MKLKNLRSLKNLFSDNLQTLPLMVLYLTDGCNSKCAMCDIWKAPRQNMDMALVDSLIQSAVNLNTELVLLSGGEAMQHPEWHLIAQKFREAGIKVWLLTNGLLLKKQAEWVINHVDMLTVSLDAATPELYQQIRGVDGLQLLLDGMLEISEAGVPTSTRTTLMRANYHQMPDIVDIALKNGANSVSFLAVDTVNPYAFGPRFDQQNIIPTITDNPYGGLIAEDLPRFDGILTELETDYADYFADGRIEESPEKLRSLYRYFAEVYGEAQFPPPRCNAPHISTVINVDGKVQPCYFLPTGADLNKMPLEEALNTSAMLKLRQAYKNGERVECKRCVCPLYRGPRATVKGF